MTCAMFKSLVTNKPYTAPFTTSLPSSRGRQLATTFMDYKPGNHIVHETISSLRGYLIEVLILLIVIFKRINELELHHDYFILKLKECLVFIPSFGVLYQENQGHSSQFRFEAVSNLFVHLLSQLPPYAQMSIWSTLYSPSFREMLVIPEVYSLFSDCFREKHTVTALLSSSMEYFTRHLEVEIDVGNQNGVGTSCLLKKTTLPVFQRLLSDILVYVDVIGYSNLFSRFLSVCLSSLIFIYHNNYYSCPHE